MSETCQWFTDWAINHAVAFGLGDGGLKTIFAWEGVFTRLFTAEELREATGELLASSDLKPFAAEHRAPLIAAIEQLRRKRRQSQEKPYEDPACPICKGMGWAIVLHPGLTPHGDLLGYLKSPRQDAKSLSRDLSVCCSCDVGERTRAGRQENGQSPLTLAVYESRYPDWRMIQDERDAVKRAEFQSEPGEADWERIKREFANRIRLPSQKTTTTNPTSA